MSLSVSKLEHAHHQLDLQALISMQFFWGGGGGTFGAAATTDLLYQPRMIDDGDCGEIDGVNIGKQGKPKYSEKTCPSATLSSTNPT
jgi:hypothetical protein